MACQRLRNRDRVSEMHSVPAHRLRRPRDPGQTRADILRAAVEEFSDHGFSGGRVDRIARSAGTNKQSIYRYYENKRGLFLAALNEGLISELEDPVIATTPLGEIESAVEELLGLLRARPELTRLLMWEMLEGVEARHERRSEVFERRRRAVRQGVAEGQFELRADVDLVVAAISALCIYPFAMAPSFQILRGRSIMEEPEFNTWRTYVMESIRVMLGVSINDSGKPLEPPARRNGRPRRHQVDPSVTTPT